MGLPLKKTNNQNTMTDNTGADGTKIDNIKNGTGDVTDTTKTGDTGTQDAKDTKSGENAFDEKVFDDPRLWTHPRFKSLNERAKKADALEKAQSEAEEKRLAEAKKFEELANKRAEERDQATTKLQTAIQDNRIITEATKIGVVDIETVLKLVDRAGITVDANGSITGVTEAIQALVTAKPFLKGKATGPIGSATNPGADNDMSAKKFKLSQIQDPAFYREHEKDILNAYKAGLVEDDMHPR